MKRLTILGGPRDGEVVDFMGSEMRMLVLRPVRVYVKDVAPLFDPIRVDRYVARQDFDGRWWYVREEQ